MATHTKPLYNALLQAFPDRESLRRMVHHELHLNLNEVAPEANLRTCVFYLLVWAESRNELARVAQGAINTQPNCEALRAVGAQYGATVPPRQPQAPLLATEELL